MYMSTSNLKYIYYTYYNIIYMYTPHLYSNPKCFKLCAGPVVELVFAHFCVAMCL